MTSNYITAVASSDLNAYANPQSVIELYGLLRPSLHAYVCSLGFSRDRAEDVIQETFLRLVRHKMQVGADENLRAWAFRVARNISVDFHRCEKRWFLGSEPDPILRTRVDPAPNPEQKLIFAERMRQLESACAQLTPRQRDCLLLRAKGLRYREIALVLGVSVQRVGEMLQRAISLLAIAE
jgi:RNA polymerase sigma-70 factor, ECF subfamily